MKVKVSNVVLFILVLVLIGLTGCAAMLDRVTPAEIPGKSVEYLIDEPVDDVISNLKEAKKVQKDVVIKHRDTQIDLKRMAEDDELKYGDALDVINYNIQESQNLQDLILNGNDVVPGVYALLMGGAGLLAGRNFLKRPGDYSPEEVEEKETN